MSYKWFTSRFTKRLQGNVKTSESRSREPLDDPALSRMNLVQLADLPIPSYVKENCTGSIRII